MTSRSPPLQIVPPFTDIPLKTIPFDSDLSLPSESLPSNEIPLSHATSHKASSVPSISEMVASHSRSKSPLSNVSVTSAPNASLSSTHSSASQAAKHDEAIVPPSTSNSLIISGAPISPLSKKSKLFALFFVLGLLSEMYSYVVLLSALSRFVREVYWYSLARTGFSPANAFFLAFFVPCLITNCQPLRKYFWSRFMVTHIALSALSYLFLFVSMVQNIHLRAVVCMISVVLALIWMDFRMSSSWSAVRYRSMIAFLLSLPVTQALQFADSSLMPFWAEWHWLLGFIVVGVLCIVLQVIEYLVVFRHPDHLEYVNSAIPDGRISRFLLSPNYEVEDVHRNKRKQRSAVNVLLSCASVLLWALSFATVFGLTFRFMFGTAVLTSWTGSAFSQGIIIILAFLVGILLSFARLAQTPAFLFLIAMPLLIGFKLIPQGDVSFVVAALLTIAWPTVLRFFLEEIQFTPSGNWSGHVGLSVAFYVFVAFSEMGTINSGFYLPLFGHIFFEREWLLLIFEILFMSLIMGCVALNRAHYFTRFYGIVPPLMQRLMYVFVVPHWVPRETELVSTTDENAPKGSPKLKFSFRKFLWRLLDVERVPSWVLVGLSVVALFFVLPSLIIFVIHNHFVSVGEQSSIRVATYNVYQGFTLQGMTSAYQIADQIEENHISVVGLQEIITTRPSNSYFSLIQVLASRTNMMPFVGSVRDTTLGCGFLSNRDYLRTSVEQLPSDSSKALSRAICEAQFHFGAEPNATLPIYTMHLELDSGGNTAMRQIERVLEKTKEQDTVILTGDFNLELSAPELQKLRDAGYYHVFEFLRIHQPTTHHTIDNEENTIDHIFFKGKLRPTHAFVIRADVSDHFVVIADFVHSSINVKSDNNPNDIDTLLTQNAQQSDTDSPWLTQQESTQQHADGPTDTEMTYSQAFHAMNRIIAQSDENDGDGAQDDDDASILSDSMQIRQRLPTGKPSTALQKLLKDASDAYLANQFEVAKRFLFEIVRQRPNYTEAYGLLAIMAEDEGRLDTALKCRVIGALLSNDMDDWREVGAVAQKVGNLHVQAYAARRLCRREPQNQALLVQLGKLYTQLNMSKRAASIYEKLSRLYPTNAEAVHQYALHLHFQGRMVEAKKLFMKYLNAIPDKAEWDATIVNMTCELLNGVFYEYVATVGLVEEFANALIADLVELPSDILLQYGIALLRVGGRDAEARQIFNHIMTNATAEFCFEVGEAYKSLEFYHDAIPIFESMVRVSSVRMYTLKNLAECHLALNEKEKAVDYYNRYLELNRADHAVRLTLSNLLRDMGRIPEALDVLMLPVAKLEARDEEDDDDNMSVEANEKEETRVEPGVRRRGRRRSHIPDRMAHEILYCVQEASFYENDPVKHYHTLAPIYRSLAHYKSSKGDRETRLGAFSTDDQMQRFERLRTVDELWLRGRKWRFDQVHAAVGTTELVGLVIKLAQSLVAIKETDRAFFILENMVGNSAFHKDHRTPLQFALINISIDAGKYKKAYKYLRFAIKADPENVQYWALLYKFIQRGLNYVHTFMFWMLKSDPVCVPALMLRGHVSMVSGVDVIALGFYIAALRQVPNDPLLNLCAAVAYLNAAPRRSLTNKHHCVLNAFAHLYRYADHSKEYPMEVNYNLARAYHALNLNTFAMEHYNKVLAQAESTVEDDNLVREAAVNLARLYEKSGNPELGRSIIMQYLVI